MQLFFICRPLGVETFAQSSSGSSRPSLRGWSTPTGVGICSPTRVQLVPDLCEGASYILLDSAYKLTIPRLTATITAWVRSLTPNLLKM